jgi:hypothetical protein
MVDMLDLIPITLLRLLGLRYLLQHRSILLGRGHPFPCGWQGALTCPVWCVCVCGCSGESCGALECFVPMFTTKAYARALHGDTPAVLGTGLDELMRHVSSSLCSESESCESDEHMRV